jgi:hypothetical protein
MEDGDESDPNDAPGAELPMKPVPDILILSAAAIAAKNVKGINYAACGNDLIKQGQVALCIFASDLTSTIDDVE